MEGYFGNKEKEKWRGNSGVKRKVRGISGIKRKMEGYFGNKERKVEG